MPRILVIEDEAHILENIVETLEMEGFDVQGINDGTNGLSTALTYKPDLILCDIMMPDVDGYHVLMDLRNESATAATPFIFLTALAARSEMRQGMELGADDYLTKPFTPTELLKAVHARLEKQEMIKEQHTKEMENLRQNIVYALPHELRTPLTGIIGCADFLLHDYEHIDRANLYNLAEVMMRAATRLSDVIENYLLYAQLEILGHDANKIEKLKEDFLDYPDAIIMDVLQNEANKEERSADIKTNVKPGVIAISHDNFAKIVTELIDNALKFSKSGTDIVVTSTVTDEGMFCFSVKDQGRGMTKEEIEQIGAYMQFERVLHEQQGLGLGLVIARKMVEIHQGHLTIESNPGIGTTVEVYLPTIN